MDVSAVREPLKRSEPKLTQMLNAIRRRTGYVFKVIGSKVKVDVAISASSRSLVDHHLVTLAGWLVRPTRRGTR